ncbi:MAG TPA: hypothetical protein VNI61_10215 [Gemmatimonadales bacterium]|nr:hypothetical protein [Gemmatimonadales bacterium]
MKYFHRTTVDPDRVLQLAAEYFGGRMVPAEETPRRRTYSGPTGKVTITARPEGGHYTLVEVSTDQVGEAELDKIAKRFLAVVHREAEPTHQLRGAY